jgi:hypothetical protein
MDEDHQTCTTKQENFRKMLGKFEKSRILIAMQHFSMALLWGQLHRDFLRFVNWSRTCGRWGNFYQIAQGQHSLLCALSTAESLSCPKSIGSIGGSTIYQSQQYSSCPTAGWYRAAQLLGGFRLRRRDVKLISQEIDPARSLFCSHSADLLSSYLQSIYS